MPPVRDWRAPNSNDPITVPEILRNIGAQVEALSRHYGRLSDQLQRHEEYHMNTATLQREDMSKAIRGHQAAHHQRRTDRYAQLGLLAQYLSMLVALVALVIVMVKGG